MIDRLRWFTSLRNVRMTVLIENLEEWLNGLVEWLKGSLVDTFSGASIGFVA